jgi:hypothetical protein
MRHVVLTSMNPDGQFTTLTPSGRNFAINTRRPKLGKVGNEAVLFP